MSLSNRFATVGAARVKWYAAPIFALHARAALRAATKAKGCAFAGVQAHNGYAFSMTVWDSLEDMITYAKGPAHARAVRWVWLTAQTSQFCRFPVDSIPDWNTAITRWEAAQAKR